MYYWRKLTPLQREAALAYRRTQRFPRHSPPHFDLDGEHRYLLSGACYEHEKIIGVSPKRMAECEAELLRLCALFCSAIFAWCILPNHYHVLLRTSDMKGLRKEIGLFYGRTAFYWNGEDDSRGRKVWNNCFERPMKSERHFFASLNYVLNNPVHHKYVTRWQDWPWSNADQYLEEMGIERATQIWRDYPILDYGAKWDVP